MAFRSISELPISRDDIINFNVKTLNKELKKISITKEERNEIKNLRRSERAKLYDAAKRDGINREIERLEFVKNCLQEELDLLRSECFSLNEMADHLVKML